MANEKYYKTNKRPIANMKRTNTKRDKQTNTKLDKQ